MADMKAMMRESAKAKREMEEMRRKAEADLDEILDEAIAEFEAEEDLTEKPEDDEGERMETLLAGEKREKRIDLRMEEDMKDDAYQRLDSLVDNLRNPAFKDTLEMTLRALSGNEEGARTIEQFVRDQRDRAERLISDEAPDVELDRGLSRTMELLATSSSNMEGLEPAQIEQSGDEMMTNMIAEFEKLGQKEDFDQIVENMLRQLLAKDLMYEPMSKVCDKYPEWLAEKYETLSQDEYQRYGTQYQYFQRIVAVYKYEPDNFPRLVELLQDLQKYGQVPSEIIKELAPALEFGPDGMPVMNLGDNIFPKPGAAPGMPGLPTPDASAANCCVS
jgi:peroxin-19